MVESFALPELLASMFPLVFELSLTDIRKLPTGPVIKPDRLMEVRWLARATYEPADAITVVPSHSFANTDAADVSFMVTVPLTNQVPLVPCATVGPSK